MQYATAKNKFTQRSSGVLLQDASGKKSNLQTADESPSKLHNHSQEVQDCNSDYVLQNTQAFSF